MRKIIADLFISLDGVVEAPDQWRAIPHLGRHILDNPWAAHTGERAISRYPHTSTHHRPGAPTSVAIERHCD